MSMFEYLKLKESVNALKDNINTVKADVANAKTDLANVKADVSNMPSNIIGFDNVSISELNGANKIVFPTQNISLNVKGFTDIFSIEGKGYLSTLNFKYNVKYQNGLERELYFTIIVDGTKICQFFVNVREDATRDSVFDFTIVKDKDGYIYYSSSSTIDSFYCSSLLQKYNDVLYSDERDPNEKKMRSRQFPLSYRIGRSLFVADFMRGIGRSLNDGYNYSLGTQMYEKHICASLSDVMSKVSGGDTFGTSIITDKGLAFPSVHTGIYYDNGLGIKFNRSFKIQVYMTNPTDENARLTADYILL